ncbi:sugar kinase [Faecalicatena contorta]|uniref:sugar kinase n=1 Tax=Faecalicatena contorta TaxID=39482 RepID=UPI00129EF97D|nr:sugar kinase [Faecalicatena contorta]MRM88996.1 sugar kinase [Faecalicatena contorta]
MAELITIGETMVAMVPEEMGLLRYKRKMNIRSAGAESNVAIGVQKLNHSTGWISRLGKDEFGQMILREIQSEGVDCSHVVWDYKHSTGLMFKQIEATDTKVFYYRSESAASYLSPEDITDECFEDCKILHLTGITPVLSDSCKDTVLKAIAIAKKHHIRLSFDPNIRKKLWKNNDYTPLLKDIMLQADIIEMGINEGQCILELYTPEDISKFLFENNPNLVLALKNGKNGATVMNRKEQVFIPPYPCNCIETIGSGDAFNAGFLCGILEEKALVDCGKMGAIAGAMATEVVGDTENQPDYDQMISRLQDKKELYR